MTRFPGWTSESLNKITPPRITMPGKASTRLPDHVGKIAAALKMLGVDSVREYKFIADRRFRFDLAIPYCKIAVEFEGGIYTRGRHTRSKGYINDVKKYNLATMHGWRLLRYTTETTKKLNWEFEAAQQIIKLIGAML